MKMQDFIAGLAGKENISKKKAEELFKSVLGSMFDAVVEDGSLRTPYGTFTLKETAARKGRNPQTGESIDIPARKKVAFAMSATYKKELNS